MLKRLGLSECTDEIDSQKVRLYLGLNAAFESACPPFCCLNLSAEPSFMMYKNLLVSVQKVYGYALFKDKNHSVVKYPMDGYTSDVAGRSFHHGRIHQAKILSDGLTHTHD
jgi:hypothetical protein